MVERSGAHIDARAWASLGIALLLFIFGSIAVNMAASRASNGVAIQRAFSNGALETVTPVALAPWWLTSRAQLDCQQFMPLVSSKDDITSAISRPKFVLADRKVNACTLLASVAERKRLSGNMRETSRQDGFHTAGSLTLPAIAVLGIPLTRWINILLMLAASGAGLWAMSVGQAQDIRHDRIAATLCMTVVAALILAVPGSLSAIPTMAILLIGMFRTLRSQEKRKVGPETVLKLTPVVAAALISLDPTGGSVAVGMGCVLLLMRVVSAPAERGIAVLNAAGFYLLTVVLCWLLYAACVGISEGWQDAAGLLQKQILDLSEAGRPTDLLAAATGTYRWLSGETLLGPLGALDMLLTVLFGLASYAAVKPVSADSHRLEPLVTALIAIAPALLWAFLYPGYWSREEDQYVLLAMWIAGVASAGPLCLIVEGARRLARKRKAQSAPSAVPEATSLA